MSLSFRAKQGPAVKSPSAKPQGSPMAGNRSPMMRSNDVMGGKTPNMVPANPMRNTSMMGPAKPQTRMMADGGFGEPEPLGGGAPPPAAPPAVPPQDTGMMPMIKPESVNYHDDPHACQGCEYFGQDSQCSVLQMQVSPMGGCNAFELKGDQDDMQGGQPGEDDNDTEMGTSGQPR